MGDRWKHMSREEKKGIAGERYFEMIYIESKGQQTLSGKCQMVNILGFGDNIVPAANYLTAILVL